jgi:Asp-tRNA(Asn)/Glu-tRNA(Gln) amidotransferase A subunit family amidase
MDKPLHTLSLIEAAHGMKNRRFTSEAYTQALLARIASFDEKIRAWAWLKPEEAIKAARLSDRHLHSGGVPGPLRHCRCAYGNGFSRLCRPCPGEVGQGH